MHQPLCPQPCAADPALCLPNPLPVGATKDMGKMLGGEEEKDPDAQKKEEERQEALRQQEEERKAKHARMEAEREKVRQQIRDKVSAAHRQSDSGTPNPGPGLPQIPAFPLHLALSEPHSSHQKKAAHRSASLRRSKGRWGA